MMCGERGTFEGASLMHLHKNAKKQCEITRLSMRLACIGHCLAHQTRSVGHATPHLYASRSQFRRVCRHEVIFKTLGIGSLILALKPVTGFKYSIQACN